MKEKFIRRNLGTILVWTALGIFIANLYFPIYWLLTMSFKMESDIGTSVPKWIFKPILKHYAWVFGHGEILTALRTSLVVTGVSTFIACLFGIPGAYVFARIQFPRKKDLEFWVLTTRMLPPVAILVPYVGIWIWLGLYDSITSLWLTHLIMNLALVLWFTSRFIKQLPLEVEEAALLDGCSRVSMLLKIVAPLAIPAIVVAAMFAFIFSWNEFFLVFVLGPTNRTATVVVASYIAHGHEVLWGQMSAAAVVASIPAFIMVILARGLIVKGFTFMGGVGR